MHYIISISRGKITKSPECERIDYLTSNCLIKICNSSSGGAWKTLYQDPNDGRYWERVYIQSDSHGGGPPSLLCIGDNLAKTKYKLR
ncbi:MAG: Imm27 family immunity protein [Pseudomonadota bacterium]